MSLLAALATLATLLIAAPALGSTPVTTHTTVNDCGATGWHQHNYTTAQFKFGTFEYNGLCDTVKAQGRYYLSGTGWVTTSMFSSGTEVSKTYNSASAHDWSKHEACDPGCVTWLSY